LYLKIFQGPGGVDQQKEMQERQQAMEDMRNSILSQVLTQQARARCKSLDGFVRSF
jgi:DNA-binding TFAR19-related protein (PDSD5 family)